MRPRYPPQVVVRNLAGPFCRCRGLSLEPSARGGPRKPPAGPRPGPGEAKGGPAEAKGGPAEAKGGPGLPQPGPGAGPAPDARQGPPALTGDGPLAGPSDEEIVSDMERFEYVRLDARRAAPRGARDAVVILVLSAAGRYSHRSPELKRLLAGVLAERPARENRLDEVLVVAEEAFFGQKFLTDLVGELRSSADAARRAAGAKAGDPGGVAAFIGAYRYAAFSLPVLEHSAVPPHRLMSAEEVAEMLARDRLELAALPLIRADDPPVIWLGGRAGQTVLIRRDSLNTLESVYYRRVVDP